MIDYFTTMNVFLKKFGIAILLAFVLLSCTKPITENTSLKTIFYSDIKIDTTDGYLTAIYTDSIPELGSAVAFINSKNDTIIPFGTYSHCWTDTLKSFALVYDSVNTNGRAVGIDRNRNILFDVVFFDNWPDELQEGLFRVKRNRKIGFANSLGEIVIPCQFECASWFENGYAKVANHCTETSDKYEHTIQESNEWFYITVKGEKIK